MITLSQRIEIEQKLCYTDTDSFIIHIKTENFFEDISNDIETWYVTSNKNDENDKRPLPKGKNKKKQLACLKMS